MVSQFFVRSVVCVSLGEKLKRLSACGSARDKGYLYDLDPLRELPLEHLDCGGNDVSDLQSFYQDDPNGLVLAPYPKLKDKIAATAWNEPAYDQNQDANFNKVDPGHGYVMTCSKFDKGALSKFKDKHRNKAGERYASVKDMAPGQ